LIDQNATFRMQNGGLSKCFLECRAEVGGLVEECLESGEEFGVGFVEGEGVEDLRGFLGAGGGELGEEPVEGGVGAEEADGHEEGGGSGGEAEGGIGGDEGGEGGGEFGLA
jgi:hypothetical protein